jgi:DNA-binding transcriptional ArsR family regulator
MIERSDISAAMALANDAARDCACLQARMLSRQITRAYDAALRDSGLKITQFTMLAAVVASGDGLSLTELSDRLGMDRSTFSRNLTPLVRRGLVQHTNALKGRSRGAQARSRPRRGAQLKIVFVVSSPLENARDFSTTCAP